MAWDQVGQKTQRHSLIDDWKIRPTKTNARKIQPCPSHVNSHFFHTSEERNKVAESKNIRQVWQTLPHFSFDFKWKTLLTKTILGCQLFLHTAPLTYKPEEKQCWGGEQTDRGIPAPNSCGTPRPARLQMENVVLPSMLASGCPLQQEPALSLSFCTASDLRSRSTKGLKTVFCV